MIVARKLKTCFFVVVLVLCLGQNLAAQHLHAFVIYDDHDRNIGESCLVDAQGMVDVLASGLDSRRYTVHAIPFDKATPSNVIAAIEGISVTAEDSILVYYSGHGAFDQRSSEHVIALSGGLLKRSKIRAVLERRSVRFWAMLTDCCASIVVLPDADAGAAMAGGKGMGESPLLNQLFFNTTGNIDITSSRPGQYSVGYSGSGGVFTAALLTVLEQHDGERLGWSDVFKKTRREASDMFEHMDARERERGAKGDADEQYTQTAWSFDTMYGANPNDVRLGVTSCNDCGQHLEEVALNSAAAKAGLEVGDMILAVNGQEVTSPERLVSLVNNSPRLMKLLVKNVRTEENITLQVELPF